jgi:hypothetical protein
MSEAIPPLPNTPSWCGAQLKHRDNFTFLPFTLPLIALIKYSPWTLHKFTVYMIKLAYFTTILLTVPVPVVVRFKARTVFDRSNTGIVGSNPARGMDVCPRFFWVMLFCVDTGLALG